MFRSAAGVTLDNGPDRTVGAEDHRTHPAGDAEECREVIDRDRRTVRI
jgi:hypothetical protein